MINLARRHGQRILLVCFQLLLVPALGIAAETATALPPGGVSTTHSHVFVLVGKTGLGHEHGVVGNLKQGTVRLGASQNAGEFVFDMASFLADSDDARKYVDLWTKESDIRKQEDAPTDPKLQLPLVVLKTNRGDVTIEMLENEAPNTVANFISLVENKFYDGLRFHRVIPGFMAQGGCPNSRDDAQGVPGTGGPGYNIDCECAAENARMHFAGSLSMAHAGKNTGGSQFFLTHLPTSHLNGVHTVFGRVISGLDVVRSIQPNDQIITATVTRKRDHEYKPVTHPEAD